MVADTISLFWKSISSSRSVHGQTCNFFVRAPALQASFEFRILNRIIIDARCKSDLHNTKTYMLNKVQWNPQSYIQSHLQASQWHRKKKFFQMKNEDKITSWGEIIILTSFMVLNPMWQELHSSCCNCDKIIQLSYRYNLVWLGVRAMPLCTCTAFSHEVVKELHSSFCTDETTDWLKRQD